MPHQEISTNATTAEIIQSVEDPLKIELDDTLFAQTLNKRIATASAWYKREKGIKTRQEKNKAYLFGRQEEEIYNREFKNYESRYQDNAIFEGEAYIKPIALSRLPDMLVKPSRPGPESEQAAKDLTEIINNDIRKRENRRVLSLAFKHMPVYFVGIIKARWDPEKGPLGDYQFSNVHPDNIVFDTVRESDPQKMDFIAERVEHTVKDIIMRFPDKEKEILEEIAILNKTKGDSGTGDEALMATKVKYWEVWFTWYKKTEQRWERIEGVGWVLGSKTLKKMKDPNWDHEGKRNLFVFNEDDRTKQSVDEDIFRQAALAGFEIPGLQEEQVYQNHFQSPKKPYMLLTYDQWGEMPYDETSRIEQVLALQRGVDNRGRQIDEMADRTRGKNVFSTDSGMDAGDVQRLDMSDPEVDVLVDGDVRQVHGEIRGEQPGASLFQEQAQNRQRIFSKMGVNDTTRGEVTTDTATTAQIARESDFGRIDDLTEETINFASEEMANWAVQFIRLRYTQDHFKTIPGSTGELAFFTINQDLVEDGMEITVKASGVDKVLRKREAFERAKLQLTDPLSFFEDTDVSDPKGRALKLMQFTNDPARYMAEHLEAEPGTPELIQSLENQPVAPEQGGGGAPAGGGVGGAPPGNNAIQSALQQRT